MVIFQQLLAMPAVQVWLAITGFCVAASIAHDWYLGRELRAINRRYRAARKAKG